MKKLLFAIILSIISVAVFSVDKGLKFGKSKTVSFKAKEQLEKDFKNAKNISWIVSSDLQQAKFTIGSKRLTAIYDIEGNYLGAIQFISYREMPEPAKKELAKKYEGYTFSEALLVVARPAGDNNGDVGSYWIDIVNDGKKVYLNYSHTKGLTLHKAVESSEIAQN